MEIKMKSCYVSELPKSLRTDVLNHLTKKTDDFVTTLHWRGYIIDCWTLFDPIQYATEKHIRRF